jgi:hypothetical protein
MIRTRALFVVSFLLSAASGFAQSVYVSAAVGMDVSRFSGVETTGFDAPQPGGEAMAVTLRAGTRVGQSWGVELGFTRPSAVEKESTFGFPIPLGSLSGGIRAIGPGASVVPGASVSGTVFSIGSPVFETRTRLQRRDTTLDTVAWIAQPVSSRVDLVYLGGIAFNRTVEEASFEITARAAILPPIIIPHSVRTTTYGLAPVVGVEARIALTDHIRLVPGVRLQGIGGGTNGTAGWLVRPSAGLMWEF